MFSANARRYRDLFVQEGGIRARYLPLLLFGIAFGLAFGHALLLFTRGELTVGQVVAFMGLFGVLRFPTFISLFSFALVQIGLGDSEFVSAREAIEDRHVHGQKRTKSRPGAAEVVRFGDANLQVRFAKVCIQRHLWIILGANFADLIFL